VQIDELRLSAYGPFSDCALSLRPGLNILYGPNEAGKSSALRAIHALFFGVPQRTPDGFVHVYDKLRVGGVVVKQNGDRLECVRRKGRKLTLRDGEDGKPLPDDSLESFLGAVDEDFFSSVFGIDHQRLREGGEEVLRGEGRVGELLFAAGGVSHLRDLQQAIDGRAGELFKPSAQKPLINKGVADLQGLRGELKSLQASSDEWKSLAEARDHHREQREMLTEHLVASEANATRLRRIQTALPALSGWRSTLSELEELSVAVLLPEDSVERHAEAHRKLSVANSRCKDARDRLESIDEDLESIDVPTELLLERTSIDGLYKRLGSHETAARDRTGLDMKERNARQSAREILRQLGWSDDLEDLEKNRVTDEKQTLIRTLSKKKEGLAERLRSAERTKKRAKKRLEELGDEAEAPLPETAVQELTTVLEDASAARDIDDQIDSHREEFDSLQECAESALSRLTLWEGSFGDLRRLKVPTDATIELFEDSNRDMEARTRGINSQLSGYHASKQQLQQDLAELEKGDTVPTEDELEQARALRDHGLCLATEQLAGNPPNTEDLSDFASIVQGDGEFTTALETSVRTADMIVDRIRREADRVANKAQLAAQSESLDQQKAECEESLNAVETERHNQDSKWEGRWREAGIAPLSPCEMKDWSKKYAGLLDVADKLSEESSTLKQLEQRRDSLRKRLSNQMSGVGVEVELELKTFKELITLGQHFVEQVRDARAERDQLEKENERAKNDIQEADRELTAAQNDLAEWQTTWADAVALLRLEPDALPEQAESVLANMGRLFDELAEADRNHRRIYGIDKTVEEFEEDAERMAEKVAPDLAERSVEEIAAQLNARMSNARDAQQRKNSLLKQREEQQELLRQAQSEDSDANAELEAMLKEAECDSVEELPTAIARSNQKRSLQGRVAELTSQLAPSCGGQSVEEFAVEAEAVDPDQLTPRINEFEEDIKRLKEERDEALTAEQREKSALEAYDGGEAAANIAAERQFLLSKLEEDSHEYVITRVAGALLQKSIERYQDRAQGPVLKLASSLFAELTCGAFEGLRADFDDSGKEVLLGARPGEHELLDVSAMSEGTRDQLYLALRLATLEHWFEQHEAIPFIVDDVLLSFDDERAKAALNCLLKLSQRTQVLFFTHHDHLVTLARCVEESSDLGQDLHVITGWGCHA